MKVHSILLDLGPKRLIAFSCATALAEFCPHRKACLR